MHNVTIILKLVNGNIEKTFICSLSAPIIQPDSANGLQFQIFKLWIIRINISPNDTSQIGQKQLTRSATLLYWSSCSFRRGSECVRLYNIADQPTAKQFSVSRGLVAVGKWFLLSSWTIICAYYILKYKCILFLSSRVLIVFLLILIESCESLHLKSSIYF